MLLGHGKACKCEPERCLSIFCQRSRLHVCGDLRSAIQWQTTWNTFVFPITWLSRISIHSGAGKNLIMPSSSSWVSVAKLNPFQCLSLEWIIKISASCPVHSPSPQWELSCLWHGAWPLFSIPLGACFQLVGWVGKGFRHVSMWVLAHWGGPWGRRAGPVVPCGYFTNHWQQNAGVVCGRDGTFGDPINNSPSTGKQTWNLGWGRQEHHGNSW